MRDTRAHLAEKYGSFPPVFVRRSLSSSVTCHVDGSSHRMRGICSAMVAHISSRSCPGQELSCVR